jgi:hypothetical protein
MIRLQFLIISGICTAYSVVFIRALLQKDNIDSHSPAFHSYHFNLVSAVVPILFAIILSS